MTGEGDSSERFTVSIGLHESFIVAHATGELDHQCANLLHRQVKDAWQVAPYAGLVLDLSGLTFCDSMGAGVLVLLLNQSREQGSPLVLSSVPGRLDRILAVTGLREFFLIEPSVEAAIQAAAAAVTDAAGEGDAPRT
ncbi:STAS domain-containing protein [Nonomuraea sp. KM90]|uniref:STAS domain-containing protein n=1 Tax=Nonomuraea sp. KM90 TaxID=3457428 RepID=UPI003FCED9CD